MHQSQLSGFTCSALAYILYMQTPNITLEEVSLMMNLCLPPIKVPFSWNSIYSLIFIIFSRVRKIAKSDH